MICKLTHLDLLGFRSYKSLTEVPLDADVVVVYGPNGSGKTSLFSAIEYALTGKVAHLSAFDSDYPRSLQNIRAIEPGRVRLEYLDEKGSTVELHRGLSDGQPISATTQSSSLSKASARFYVERCYLSQAQLSQLFESYQEVEGNSDQPLVTFARELLGLEPLENITDGLHIIGNVARLDNVSSAYKNIKSERAALPSERQQLLLKQRAAKSAFDSSIALVEAALAGQASSHGIVEWTLSTLRARRSAIEAERATGKRQNQRLELQRVQGRLESAVQTLSSLRLPEADRKDKTRESLRNLTALRDEYQQTLAKPIANFETLFRENSARFLPSTDSDVAPDRLLDRYEAEARQLLKTFQDAAESTKELQSRILLTQNKRQELEEALTLSISESSLSPSRLQAWTEILRAVAERISDDNCPICSRDYSELNIGPLKTHVEGQIAELGGDIKRLNEVAARKAELELASRQTNDLLNTLERQLADQASIRKHQENLSQKLTLVLNEELQAVADARSQFTEIRNRIAALTGALREMEGHEQQHAELTQQIQTIATALEVQPVPDRLSWAKAAIDIVQSRTAALEEADRKEKAVIDVLRSAENVAEELRVITDQLDKLEARSAEIETSWHRVEECIKLGKEVAAAAVSAKKSLLENLFDGALNGLWKDLFKRLVKADRFTPQLKLTQGRGRQLRTHIEGHADGVTPFGHVGSVLSAGNFNTAALSLFLSVHLMESPKHQLLVLDDPVQNIDDIHVVQLASLLRTIVHETKRQLVVGVHEKALFDYLCLELGPTSQGQSLLAIKLTGGAEFGGTGVQWDKRVWQKDKLQLGA
jgi:exonuclease SbcC